MNFREWIQPARTQEGRPIAPIAHAVVHANVTSRGRALLMLFLFSDVGKEDVTCLRKSPPVIIEKLAKERELRDEEGQAYGRADYRRAEAGRGRPNGERGCAGAGGQ